ncbi:hypothetical protein BJ138DRAFT_1229815 [Hygrophoropsis aurantiaca]|uniref:Uncharacterized protein n=1 Tax=Hygrophoropsis aurantiaca TaxID=72124 RepID=A0ACB7ZXC1_9AGAM|nr:hypothetical protein BJ138DRAFT_1229815 [Hygrophoropsis aurantiaca]
MSSSQTIRAHGANHKVLSSRYLLSQILSFLSLPEILDNASQVNKTFKSEANYTAVARFSSIVSPYVSDHVHALADLLRENRGIIVGSCALKMLLSHQPWRPHNLNIIVPRDSVNIFLTFFNSKRYSPTQAAVTPHLKNYVSRYFVCEHLDRPPVTIAESMDNSALTPFLAASCTAEFVCMTGGGLASMYTAHTSSNLALRSPLTRGVPSVWTTMVDRGFVVKTTSQQHPHDICPALWRRVNGLRDIWASTIGGDSVLHAQTPPANTTLFLDIIVLVIWFQICLLSLALLLYTRTTIMCPLIPPVTIQQNSYRTLYYGNDMIRPTMIAINVDKGVTPPITPDDMALGDKIFQGPPFVHVINPKIKVFACMPGDPSFTFQNPFTVIVDHPTLATPNNCIGRMFRCSFRGNALVMKTTHQMVMLDLCDDDVSVINMLMGRAIRSNEL